MRRTSLLILSFLFLALCVTCLFYSDHSGNMLIALAVQLIFFIQFAVFQKPGMKAEIQKDSLSDNPAQKEEEKFEIDVPVSDIQNVQKVISNVI
jgi:hypothetical protein